MKNEQFSMDQSQNLVRFDRLERDKPETVFVLNSQDTDQNRRTLRELDL